MHKNIAFHAGYAAAKLFDARDMPLDISIGEVLLIGGIGILLLLGVNLYG